MKEDITYQEIEYLKNEINSFLETIINYANRLNRKLDESDITFFRYISKQIIFLKYLVIHTQNTYTLKVLISDYFHLMIALIKRQERYVYLNERSIIEGYLRMIVSTESQKNYINRVTFEKLRELESVSDQAYSVIKEEYRISCGYIHGAEIMQHTLLEVFNELTKGDKELTGCSQYYKRVTGLIKVFNNVFITENKEFVDGVFHRKKSLMSYLVGSDNVEILFVKNN